MARIRRNNVRIRIRKYDPVIQIRIPDPLNCFYIATRPSTSKFDFKGRV